VETERRRMRQADIAHDTGINSGLVLLALHALEQDG
jgi:hypothetical protein